MTCFNLGCKADWVLQNHTHCCFWGYLPAHIVIGLQKHMSRQPINLRCVCSQFGDQNHRSMAVMSHRRRTPEMSSASFRKNMPELEAVITSLVLNQCCRLAEILLRSPRKIFILIIQKYIHRIKISQNNLKKMKKNFTVLNALQ